MSEDKMNLFIAQLISKMTLKEKMGQLNQKLYGWKVYEKNGAEYQLTDEFKKHVKWGGGIGALYGLFRADPWSKINFDNGISKEDSYKVTKMIQDYIKENTRFQIPVLFSEECPHGHQALDGMIYPSNIGIGSSWNTKLEYEVASSIAEELSSKGSNFGLISTLDILRDPRWGRSEESYGEDPYLASQFTKAVVRGMQGDVNAEFIPNNKVGTVLKVLCGHGGSEGGHNSATTNIGERELREIHLPPVQTGATEAALGFMAAYNEIDGIPCHANKKLLTNIMRDEFKFKGLIMADGCALDRLVLMTNNNKYAAKLALESGIDLSLWDDIYTQIERSVIEGIIDEKFVDRAVYRVLYVKYKLGLFSENRIPLSFDEKKGRKNNIKIAKESVVLLKNKNNILPLNKDIKNIAVIGPNANTPYNQLGDYTPPVRSDKIITLLKGIQDSVTDDVEVTYTKGCGIRDKDRGNFKEALKNVENADVVILALGGSSARNFEMEFHSNGAVKTNELKSEMNCGENVDLASLELEGVQNELLQKIAEKEKPIITILIQGRPHIIGTVVEKSDAVLCAWYPGQYGGTAISNLLFGGDSPSGKLSVSIPRCVGQLPVYYNKKDDGSKKDYVDVTGEPAFPFGFGLSYTKFSYDNLKIERAHLSKLEIEEGKKFIISIDVTNIGKVTGKEIVQLYIKDMEASTVRRNKELKGFQKMRINPGKKETFVFYIGLEELSIWDVDMINTLERGKVKIMIGRSSKIIEAEAFLEIE
jgi:beta-glucosidase